jgi:hypothetical protein
LAQLAHNPSARALRQCEIRFRASCRNFHLELADFLLERIAFHWHDLMLSLRTGTALSRYIYLNNSMPDGVKLDPPPAFV